MAVLNDFRYIRTSTARSARGIARVQIWCAPIDFPDKIDEFWLLDRMYSSNSRWVRICWRWLSFGEKQLFFPKSGHVPEIFEITPKFSKKIAAFDSKNEKISEIICKSQQFSYKHDQYRRFY